MKKLFLVAAMTVMLGSFGSVFATGTLSNTEKSKNIEVTYSLGESYTITIPDKFDFTAQGVDVPKTVSASEVLVNAGSKLQVVITGANCGDTQKWFLKDVSDVSNTAEYTVKKGETLLKSGDTILEVPAGTATGTVDLVFNLKSGITKAGTYKDTLTFTSSIVVGNSEPGAMDPF